MPYSLINSDWEALPKALEFCAKLRDSSSTDVETFTFFTDPHLLNKELDGPQTQARLQNFMEPLRRHYEAAPMNFILSGGDWLTCGDTMEEACGRLGMLDGYMRSHFHDYYPVLGNHDSNYQGVDEKGEQLGIERVMSQTLEVNLQFRQYRHTYYSFNAVNTIFFVLDSQLDWNATEMNDFKWEQLRFVADALQKGGARHYAIALHMWWWYNGSPDAGLIVYLKQLINAYNDRKTLTLQDAVYDFANADGRIEFVICGHNHEDVHTKVGTCPVIATTLFRGDGDATFDMIFVDYDRRLLHCVRVGAGQNRTFSLESGDLLS